MKILRPAIYPLLLWIILFFLMAGEGAAQPTVKLRFYSQASVQEEVILLGDIAAIQGSPRSEVEKLARVKIQASPLPGEVRVLSRQLLASKIGRSGLSSLIANLDIPEEIEVERRGRIMEREEIMRIVEDHLQGIIGRDKKTVRVKEVQGGDRVIVPADPVSWEIKAPERFQQGGSVPVSLQFSAGGRKSPEFRFHARVEIHAQVVTARTYLSRNQILEERDLRVVSKNITLQPPDVLTDLREAVGKRMTLSLNSQEILRKSMVEIPPLVKKGDRVTLLVEKDYFRITALGEMKEDGREGDRVRAVNVSSRKEIHGRVLDAHTILVEF